MTDAQRAETIRDVVIAIAVGFVVLVLLVGYLLDRRDKKRGRAPRDGRAIRQARREDRRDARAARTRAAMGRSWNDDRHM